MAELEYDRGEDGVATILLNRPERKNAFTASMLGLWLDALLDATASDEVRAVVVRGAGGAFCAGVDFNELERIASEPLAQKRFIADRVQPIARAVAALDKPLLACVSGPAVGAGMDMALMCDMRFADPTARFCESYVNVGLVPGAGGCYYLPRIVGVAKAFELLLGAEFVDAEEAGRIGLVNRVFAESDLIDRTYDFARRLAAVSPTVGATMKRTLYQSARSDLETSLELAATQIGVLRSTADSREALSSLREKRPPVYTGN
jgi:enoyl-CoA hydratase/carnithine racemase